MRRQQQCRVEYGGSEYNRYEIVTQHQCSLPESPDARETSSECQNLVPMSSTRGLVTSLLTLHLAQESSRLPKPAAGYGEVRVVHPDVCFPESADPDAVTLRAG